jgi:(1->4)-alpha-D-glucan 1-alpha-D-glucosylmutase
MIPRATYRLQLHSGFTFADAEALVPYLADLGVSHLYASPITTAASGSTHGYDVIDPTRINPELGGEAGLLSLVGMLQWYGLGLIIDIVPNHMGVAGDENLWWMDVLENGPASEYAPVFDIDWREPVALPVLGTPLAEAIAQGSVKLAPRGDRLGVQLYDGAIYPIRADDPIHASPDDPSPEALAALLDRQHYRLLYWRAANDALNWRRFFSINELAGVRIEDPAVFERTHALYFDLFARGLIDGVRVDHVDGLTDPAGYCRDLRRRFEEIAPDRPAYIVVEKILAADEPLAADWAIEGTSGYDFMRQVSEVMHDPTGQVPLGQLWEDVSGRSATFADEAVPARQDLLAWQFEGQLGACVASLRALAAAEGRDWLTTGMLRRAVERLMWVFPVYRTYATGQGAPLSDGAIRDTARAAALPLMPPGEAPVLDVVLEWLAGESKAGPELLGEAVRRFQQLSAPIAAKGVEDTAFYRHGVLLSANDVGFDPDRFACSLTDFHDAMQGRAQATPRAMLATATHDHKRGEDARARLAALSAVPEAWESRVQAWLEIAALHAETVDPADAYLLFQTLVGAWQEGDDGLLERVHAWQVKALREGKLRSSWEAPDEAYEARCHELATLLLTGDEGAAFREDFAAFMGDLAAPGLANTLAQTALHLLAPGVPDIYQGCELMDYSLVDPDNRRPVDYDRRRDILANGASEGEAAKLRLVASLLDLRKRSAAVRDGSYEPLAVTGSRAAHVLAFARRHGGETVLCAVALRLGGALLGKAGAVPDAEWWADTHIEADGARIAAGDLFSHSLVAVDVRTPEQDERP